jgi:hypothetical protein
MTFEKIAPDTITTLKALTNHDFDMGEFTQRLCHIGGASAVVFQGACGIQSQVLYGSYILVFCLAVGNILLMLGAGFQWYQYFVRSRNITRQWMKGFHMTAAIFITVGMTSYVVMTSQINSLPPSATGSTWAGGNSTILAMTLTLCCWVPVAISFACLDHEGIDEIINENISEQKKFLTGEAMYGSHKPYHETSQGLGVLGVDAAPSQQPLGSEQQPMGQYQQQGMSYDPHVPYDPHLPQGPYQQQDQYQQTGQYQQPGQYPPAPPSGSYVSSAGGSQAWQTGYSTGPQSDQAQSFQRQQEQTTPMFQGSSWA